MVIDDRDGNVGCVDLVIYGGSDGGDEGDDGHGSEGGDKGAGVDGSGESEGSEYVCVGGG